MTESSVLVLSGGVGGAKLCLGLQRVLPAGCLNVLVNTGDDFDHLGLRICPDLDTTLYTLGGIANQEVGWGRHGETWTFMEALAILGGETWFRLGDGDLAIHVERTRRLSAGESLSEIVADFSRRLAIKTKIFPMSDDRVSTVIKSPEGDLSFQEYFVRRSCSPVVQSLTFESSDTARIPADVAAILECSNLTAIVVAPSNPYLSIAPILAIPGLRAALRETGVPIVAVTPIIDGSAVKGPTAKIMQEMSVLPTPAAIAEYYSGFIDGFILDDKDASFAAAIPVPTIVCNTLMVTLDDRIRVAKAALDLATSLKRV